MTAGQQHPVGVQPDEKRVFLHIGAPKTGTSYLQSRLTANRTALAEQGYLWVLPWSRQVEAVRSVKALPRLGRLGPRAAWTTMAGQLASWPGNSMIVSMEWLMNAREYQAQAAVHAFGAARVEVVVTARDLVRVLPATWQESTQNFRTWDWHGYVRAVVAPDGPARREAREFWASQDIARVVEQWSAAVPPERIHLVTVPAARSGSEMLWERFASVVGLGDGAYVEPSRDNPSLGVVSASLLRQLNLAAEGRLSRQDYRRLVKHVLAKQVLARRRAAEGGILVPADVQESLRSRAERMVADLRQVGVDVVGDLEELLPREVTGGRDPGDVTEGEMLEAALEGLTGLVEHLAEGERVRRRETTGRRRSRAHLRRGVDRGNRLVAKASAWAGNRRRGGI